MKMLASKRKQRYLSGLSILLLLFGMTVQPAFSAKSPNTSVVNVPKLEGDTRIVLIEVRIWESSRETNQEFDSDILTYGSSELDDIFGVWLGGSSFTAKPSVGLAALDFDVLNSQYGTMRLRLSAMESLGEAQVLANPAIFTANGQPARIQTGDKIPVLELKNGQTVTTTKDTGVTLIVTPIIQGQYVELDVDASVKLVTRYVTPDDPLGEGRSYEYPVIASRQIMTKLTVASGQGLFLGGLTEEVEQETVRSVPFVSDFPWLPGGFKKIPGVNLLWLVGKLFTGTSQRTLRKELFLEISPQILEPGELVPWQTEILPEDKPKILELYDMGLMEMLPDDDELLPPVAPSPSE